MKVWIVFDTAEGEISQVFASKRSAERYVEESEEGMGEEYEGVLDIEEYRVYK